MNHSPKIICFESGLQIVADVEESIQLDSEGKYMVHYPMEVMRIPVNKTQEAYSIRPWMSFTSATAFEINKSNVLSIAPLSEYFAKGFEELKETYFEDIEGEMSEEDDDVINQETIDDYLDSAEYDEETLKEMVEEIVGRRKRVLH
jgi:hypothetical protein|tara:strand:- start:7405 stop:7842 length:438 start_codon:yes stop_codon:yes gene_type:complete